MRAGSRTLGRGLHVLRALGDRAGGSTVAQLSADTALDRAVLYRLLETLCAEGFALRHDTRRTYHLGVALVELGAQAGRSLAVRQVAIGPMQELMEHCGEAVCLTVREGDGLVVVERVEPAGMMLRVAYDVGTRHSLERGAHGRILSTQAGPGHGADLAADETATEGAVGERAAVRRAVVKRAVVKGAWPTAISADEMATGTSGVAAGVLDGTGRIVAAVGIVAPTPRLPDPTRVVAAVQVAAELISRRLGFGD